MGLSNQGTGHTVIYSRISLHCETLHSLPAKGHKQPINSTFQWKSLLASDWMRLRVVRGGELGGGGGIRHGIAR